VPGEPYTEDMKLGSRFWLRLIGVLVLICVGGLLMLLLFGSAWARWGGVGAFILFGVLLLAVGYFYDRRQAKNY
jgi:hypothetical protein